jgi:Ni/Co efflux regulator RcnB
MDHGRDRIDRGEDRRGDRFDRGVDRRDARDRVRARDFDRRDWSRNARAAQRYRWGAYSRPPGWSYRRWGYGQILPRAYWKRNYWIDSYWSFGLATPPWGYEWVRYGDDAILVDVRSGEILQTQYDIFY